MTRRPRPAPESHQNTTGRTTSEKSGIVVRENLGMLRRSTNRARAQASLEARNGGPRIARAKVRHTPAPPTESLWWSGVVGSTWWFFLTGPSTDALWQAYVAHGRAMLDSGEAHPSLVCIAHRADPPPAEHRRIISDAIKADYARLKSLRGFVLVMDSPLHLLALKAINWLVHKPFAERVCGSPSAAAHWLQRRGVQLDERALVSSLKQHIPAEHMWPNL